MNDIKKVLKEKGCVYEGHFVGVSGKHLAGYCNIDPLLPHTTVLKDVTEELVKPFAKDDIDSVVVPAVGAIPLSQWGPYFLEKLSGKTVLGVWADKVPGDAFDFERSGFKEAVSGKRVLILEDMINQMASVKKISELVKKNGGTVVGVASIASNKGVSAEAIGVDKYVGLADIHYDVWTAEDCAKTGLCSQNVPIVIDVGHGSDFQEEHPDYAGGYENILA